jgi:hypothetical protein
MVFNAAVEAASFATPDESPHISIRTATMEDLDVMVEIAVATMPMDPQWNWRFPYRLQFPEDTRRFTRTRYEEFLRDGKGHWLVTLAEYKENSHARAQVIAMAIWEVKNLRIFCEGPGPTILKCSLLMPRM